LEIDVHRPLGIAPSGRVLLLLPWLPSLRRSFSDRAREDEFLRRHLSVEEAGVDAARQRV
jgi:hypothetical protein